MCKKGALIILQLLAISAMPCAASVCFTVPTYKIYDYSDYMADFNKDGIDDLYTIFDEHSTISLSRDGDALIDEYEIHETWAINEDMIKSAGGIATEIQGIDADLDGFMDVVAAFGSRIVVRINDGGGGFTDSNQFLELTDLYGTDELPISESKAEYNSKLVSMDLNKDSYDDLLVVHKEGVSIFINDETGLFSYLKIMKLRGWKKML
jgi:hypothetical protein